MTRYYFNDWYLQLFSKYNKVPLKYVDEQVLTPRQYVKANPLWRSTCTRGVFTIVIFFNYTSK